MATVLKGIREDMGILRREIAALIWNSWDVFWRRCHEHWNLKMSKISTLEIRGKVSLKRWGGIVTND